MFCQSFLEKKGVHTVCSVQHFEMKNLVDPPLPPVTVCWMNNMTRIKESLRTVKLTIMTPFEPIDELHCVGKISTDEADEVYCEIVP